MKLKHVVAAAMLAVLIQIVGLVAYGVARAHTGSPTAVTWSAGQRLTVDDLNNTVAHLHNTFSAGIVNAHLSTSAAIAHSKLATPALVAKAVLTTSTACVGAGAAGTDCTTDVEHSQFLSTSGGAGSGNSALEASGSSGLYLLSLSYTPTDDDFIVVVSSGTSSVWCSVAAKSTTAPHFQISCENDASTLTDANINVVVFDTD